MGPVREILSDREQRFEEGRKRLGYVAAPIVGLLLWFLPMRGLTPEGHHLMAILGLVATLWVTEALPLAVTALLGPALCVVAGVAPARLAFSGFADPVILLFLASFILAEGMLHHRLNRRIAFRILSLPSVARSPTRLITAFGFVTGFLSMWCSNTATAAMMYPIAMAILAEIVQQQQRRRGHEVRITDVRWGTALMLVMAFAASLGGIATPVGTPPNLVALGQIEQALGVRIGFFQWMLFGVPISGMLIVFLVAYLGRHGRATGDFLQGGEDWFRSEREKLGSLTRGERNVLLAFGLTVGLWVVPGISTLVLGDSHPISRFFEARVPESVAALIGAVLLFALPLDFAKGEFTLTWQTARRIDWGTILLFGGGLSLGGLMFNTGLANWIGEGLAGALQAKTTLGLVALFAAVAIVLSETTSNTASAAMIVPVAIAVARAAGVDPIQPALAACLGASMGFMLPVSTPPNAIVYGSGCVPLMKMIRYGILLDVAGFAVVVAVVLWVVPLVL